MAFDIDEQLSIIASQELGDTVRNAVADAARILSNDEVDIDNEIISIRSSLKGYDIRVAIHNALYKLARYEPEPPEPPTPPAPVGTDIIGVVDHVRVGPENVTVADNCMKDISVSTPVDIFLDLQVIARPYLCRSIHLGGSNVVDVTYNKGKGVLYEQYMDINDYCDLYETERYRDWKYMVGDSMVHSLPNKISQGSGYGESIIAIRVDATDTDGNPLCWHAYLYTDCGNDVDHPLRLWPGSDPITRNNSAPGHLSNPNEFVHIYQGLMWKKWSDDNKTWCVITGISFALDKNNHSGGDEDHPEYYLLPGDVSSSSAAYIYYYPHTAS